MEWLQNSFLNLELCDLKLSFLSFDRKTDLQLPAQTFILRACFSPVLRRMVDHEELKAKESDPAGFKVLEVGGVEPEVAVFFLEYLYKEDIPPVSEMELLYLIKAADMYDLQGLVELCEKRLSPKINLDNVVFIYDFLDLLPSPAKTKAQCLTTLGQHATDMFRDNLHLRLSEDTLKAFLKTSVLYVDNEYVVLRAMLEWSKRKCLLSFEAITKAAIFKAFETISMHMNWVKIDISSENFPDAKVLEYLRKTKADFPSDKSSLRLYRGSGSKCFFVWPTN